MSLFKCVEVCEWQIGKEKFTLVVVQVLLLSSRLRQTNNRPGLNLVIDYNHFS